MAPRLAALCRDDPGLLQRLAALEQRQAHLLAFALAHERWPAPADAIIARVGAPARAVAAALGLSGADGLEHLLGKLTPEMLSPRAYRRMARLLADPGTAGTLRRAPRVDRAHLRLLAILPPPLRTAAVIGGLAGIPDGARLLCEWMELVAERRGDRDGSAVASILAAAASTGEFQRRLATLAEELPLPERLPPATVGRARRLDTAADMRQVARTLGRALDDRLNDVAMGISLFYHRETDLGSTIWEVRRAGRLGWMLFEPPGLHRPTLEDFFLPQIRYDFRRAGIRSWRLATFIDEVARAAGHRCTHMSWLHRTVRPGRRAALAPCWIGAPGVVPEPVTAVSLPLRGWRARHTRARSASLEIAEGRTGVPTRRALSSSDDISYQDSLRILQDSTEALTGRRCTGLGREPEEYTKVRQQ